MEHSVAMRKKVVKYVGSSPVRFAELVKVFLSGPFHVTQRAAWPLSFCVADHPELAGPHLRKLIRFMEQPGTHNAVRRNVLRLMAGLDIPPSLQGPAANASIRLLADVNQPIAVRCFAMSVLGNIATSHPGLSNEIIPIIEEQLPYATPGFRSRAKRVLGRLKATRR